jgi:uncharacterized protein involved in exopolysaccharide biosynthesis
MEEKGNLEISDNSDITGTDALHFLALLLRHKLFIIIFTILSMGVAGVVSFMLPNEYVATVSIVPPKTSNSLFEGALSSMSSALKDMGLTKFGGQADGYTFMVILQSRTLADSMISKFNLMRRYKIKENIMDYAREKFYENLSINIEKAGNYTVSVWDTNPDTAALMSNTFIALANQKAQELSQMEAQTNRVYLEQRLLSTELFLKNLADSLSVFARKTGIFSPLDQAKAISLSMAELKAKAVESEIYYELFKNTYGANDPYTDFYGQMKTELNDQIGRSTSEKGFAGNFTLNEAAGIGIEYLRIYTEFETQSKVKAMLIPMLEKSRLDEKRNSQNLFVVDEALKPSKKDRPKRSIIIAGSGIGSLVVAILLVILSYNFRNLSRKLKAINIS